MVRTSSRHIVLVRRSFLSTCVNFLPYSSLLACANYVKRLSVIFTICHNFIASSINYLPVTSLIKKKTLKMLSDYSGLEQCGIAFIILVLLYVLRFFFRLIYLCYLGPPVNQVDFPSKGKWAGE